MSGATRNVVVTGASAGAGRAIARYFGARGWRVAVVSRNRARLERAAREIESAGGEALVLPADTADAAAVMRVRDEVMAAWGRIDVWVNAAMATIVSPIVQIRPEEFRRVTEVTYLGYVHGTLAALEVMRPVDRGVIVQVGSALAYRAIPLQSAYCAAKFAVRGFTDALRSELLHERSHVRVTMVQMPGMNTPQFDWARNKFADKYQPVGKVFQPEVAARAVYRAATHGPRELWVGSSTVQAIVGQLVAPGYMDRLLARKAWNGQITRIPERPGRPDNLETTVEGPYGAHGRFDDRAHDRAMVLNPLHARLSIAALLAGFAVALTRRACSTGRTPETRRP
ncbi:MAG TPA: SDR family oxidoreductase [Casimicrobiaceae bacterium]|nr:SDR family oxidoreductase [Casimicrobiaceae bacterium]